MSKYLLLFIYTLSFLLLLSAPLVQSASSDEEKYDERRDIGQASQQYSAPTNSDKKANPNPSELKKKSSSTTKSTSHNEGSTGSPSDESQDTPIGGTGNRK
ncbi:hypothetical protein [Nitrosomonas sp. Nm166]|uniref:hypothetical protein n=1 Tax=Nitrosomonas sp. Nm166 TaxID=1881054 RepID=UPI0008E060D7|nr:hypothetical protein [Nitrosomonas sp. Nm166]SFE12974.1 hypothetical protein SAMN05428977_100759 [Nitrosomonas sp. Nm166]